MNEAQRWHLSPERLYLDCWTRHFLREQLEPTELHEVCNIGVGLGEFDDWLGYWLEGHGSLTSVDIDEHQVRSLGERQAHEGHPNPAHVVHADLMRAEMGPFDLVTAVGSTLHETHAPSRALLAARAWVKPGGLLYATVVHDFGDPEHLLGTIEGIEARRTWSDLPGAEFTAVLVRC